MSKRPLPPMLWHYTNRRGLLGILESRTIWATDARHLNDSSELAFAVDLFCELATERRESAKSEIERTLYGLLYEEARRFWGASQAFVASLSAVRDDLSQWRAYGERGAAYALGFDSATLVSLCDTGSPFGLVVSEYAAGEQRRILGELLAQASRRASAVRDLTPSTQQDLRSVALQTAMQLCITGLSLKHPKFGAEQEWRLISLPSERRRVRFRDGRSHVALFQEITLGDSVASSPLREVLIGPSPHAELDREAVRGALVAEGAPLIRVTNSEIPFRNW